MKTGKFITLEGGDGVGKSTNLAFIASYLTDNGCDAIVTREPGGTDLGEKIRQLLLGDKKNNMSNDAELLLIFAARAQHLKEIIIPSLESGSWVVCDRFTDASYAYQGGGRQMALKNIRFLEKWIQGFNQPDLTILLDAPIEIGMSRAQKRGELDRFEIEKSEFFMRVRTEYLKLAKNHSDRIAVVDATQSITSVQVEIKKELEKLLDR